MKEEIKGFISFVGIGLSFAVVIAALLSVILLGVFLANSCQKKPLPDPILGFWRSTETDEPYGWAFYSDGQFGRYVELCPDPDSPLKFYWAGNWQRTGNGITLNDTIHWRLDFQSLNACTVTTPEQVFSIKREMWGE